jgi:tRNA (guanine10-N2)-dimethyltransferase
MLYICILGRQPQISLAELEAVFGSGHVTPLISELALVEADTIDIDRLGGTQKVARVLDQTPLDYLASLPAGKITLGISDFRRGATAATAQRTAAQLKHQLSTRDSSVRIIPNYAATRRGVPSDHHSGGSPVLPTATTLHNSLGGRNPHKIELVYTERHVAVVTGVQSIAAYTRRDQARPARDARVGMLPPKLAQILINLATSGATSGRLLDPFCGTGVILQEALLMGLAAYGTDLEPRMIDYSKKNLDWLLSSRASKNENFDLAIGNAETFQWTGPIDFVATETYLGQPFSAPPSEAKLREVQHVTTAILRDFLRNLHSQIKPGTPLALAIPAWKRSDGSFSHLKILDELPQLGYNLQQYQNLEQRDLLYHRPDQVVAREILVLRSK